ncbi:hypothetical protein [Parabacteroides sp. AM08-6]|uniref:hypothetical protein n=1 Tax=Parabacteroides sp. AM08-6 TaxID=2292053 RepID=UPI000EFF47C0|nr:hypothetical protein [Parabacteroides sp. AM08-6]RHJ74416.1 hypothetical protein DW103_17880 [Parabacteroides sp. AM08-6]
MEQLWDILRELVNAGFGIWGIVLFIQMRRLKKAEITRDTITVYQEIVQMLNETTTELKNEIKETKNEMDGIKQIVPRIEECKHYVVCPARPVVQDYKRKYFHVPVRQSKLEQKGFRYPRDNPVESGQVDRPDGQPP